MTICPICSSRDTQLFIVVKNYDYFACNSCRAVYLGVIDDNEQVERHTSSEYKQSRIRADSLNTNHNKWLAAMIARIKRSGSVLDVGSGAGYFVKTMRDFGYDAVGLDLGEENVVFARDNLSVAVLNQDFLTMTGKYDIITFNQLIEHVSNPNAFISKARSMLREHGLIIISTPNLYLARILAKLPRPILGDALGHPPNHCILFEPKTIRWMLEQNGFEVTSIRNNPTGLKGNSKIRHIADTIMNAAKVIGPNMIISAEVKTGHTTT
ncbi:MAG: class I SAM-dependent methyltransferase [Verrucomicrobia bacterium]|jgi:2-polyprenyl-3-methyl-5-hydroxy-6-metoxy-1,4-benzoquinol methylase|nr:class I SAM-dependent methyltransferase [Verrucomicrobiota bacterium]